MKHFKGITPVISIIILLLITVAIAGAAYTFLGGYLGAYTEKAFTIPPGGAFCYAGTDGNTVVATVQNMGTTTIKAEDWSVAQIDEYDLLTAGTGDTSLITEDLPTQSSKELIDTMKGTDPWGSGSHVLRLGTASGVVTDRIVCP
ncbi:MAG: hypothetical protein ISS36_01950 [Candidatus Aenigmarchaeota archaeon]|nr:hypothetical protein [Candidatus Aenigmarchaeota archaeon]